MSPPLKIALLGTAPGWREAPWGQSDWQIWGLNDGYRLWLDDPHRATRWFELHGRIPLTEARRPEDHWDRLDALKIPVYYLANRPQAIKRSIQFPLERVRKIRADYFACTYAYQIGLALLECVSELTLCGTPLIGPREALVERPCVEWWLGLAHGRGVKVTIHHQERMGLGRHPYLYAYEDRLERGSTLAAVMRHQRWVVGWIDGEAMIQLK